MAQTLDVETAEVTLSNGETETLELNTSGNSDDVVVMIDDGTSGSNAASYDLLAEVEGNGNVGYQYFDEVTGETALSWQDPAIGERMRYTLTNSSGGSANYRVTILVQR